MNKKIYKHPKVRAIRMITESIIASSEMGIYDVKAEQKTEPDPQSPFDNAYGIQW